MAPPLITYHLVQRDIWEALNPAQPYEPESLRTEGFIHCTDGAENLVETANRYYQGVPGAFLVLEIERALVQAEIRYDDAARRYPHVYGPLNRDAVVGIRPIQRAHNGAFLGFEPTR